MKKNTPITLEILRDWYFIDSVLLNDHAKYAITEKKDYDEYISLKGAMLSDLQEFYKYIDYQPKIDVPDNHRHLQENARKTAIKTKSISARMLENHNMMSHMKKIIHEKFQRSTKVDFNELSSEIINERFLKMCLDNILVGKPMLECKNQDKVSDFKSEILEEAYLAIRSDLIKISENYNNSFNKKKVVTEGWKRNFVKLAIGGAVVYVLSSATKRAIESFENRCTSRCGSLRLNASAKKACMLKCKIQTQQKIISALRQSASQTNNQQARKKFAKDVKRAQLRMTKYQRELAELSATRAGSGNLDPSERSRLY